MQADLVDIKEEYGFTTKAPDVASYWISGAVKFAPKHVSMFSFTVYSFTPSPHTIASCVGETVCEWKLTLFDT